VRFPMFELLENYFVITIFLSIFLAIASTFCTYHMGRMEKNSRRVLAPVLIAMTAFLLLGIIPIINYLSGFEIGNHASYHTTLVGLIPCILLWPMAFSSLYFVIEDQISQLKKWNSIFLVSLFSSFSLLFMGFVCAFTGDYFSVYQIIIIPGLVGFLPKFIGIFLEGCIFACGSFGILVFFSKLWETYKNRADDSTARSYVIMGGGALVLTGVVGFIVSAPDSIRTIVCLIFLGLIAGTGIVFFFTLQRVANKYLRIGIPAILGLLFLGTIVIAPLIPCLFFFGEGTMIIIMAGLGAVTLLPLIQEKIHKLSVLSALIIASPAIVLGFLPYGILNFLTHCASMEDRISSEPGLFLAVYLTSMGVSVIMCWILIALMDHVTKNRVR
jgi:hypothetical protein